MLLERWLCAWRVRLGMLFDRRRADRELEEELRHHVALATEARRAQGVPLAEARRQALVSLGGLESARNHVRDARFAAALMTSWQDLRFAVRGLVRRPLASAVAVATLSLGLASVTALFAVTDAVILQPVGDRDSRLVRVWKDDVERGGGLLFPISYPEYLVWKDEATGFGALAAINYADGATTAVLIDDEPVTANRVLASAELLEVVGARPAHGRLLEAADDVESAELVAVVSHRFWLRVSGDPAFVGRRLRFPGDTPFTVVGVLQPDVAYPVDADIWFPLVPVFTRDPGEALDSPRTTQFHVVGRLAPGVSAGEARSELAVIHGRLSAAYPADYPRMPIVATPLVDTVVGHVRPTLALLLAGAALVFLVAGANVAILLLMRAESRRVEMAARSALGATRGQLLRQTVIEAAVLGVAGVGGALIVGRGLLALTNVIDPGHVPRIDEASLGPGVLAFTVVAMTAWVLAFGTAPAWQTRAARLRGSLAHRSTEPARGAGRRLQVMAAAQIAFAVVVPRLGRTADPVALAAAVDRPWARVGRRRDDAHSPAVAALRHARRGPRVLRPGGRSDRTASRRGLGRAVSPAAGNGRDRSQLSVPVRRPDAGRGGDERVGQLGHRDAAVLRDHGHPDRERAPLCDHRHRRRAARGDREREHRRPLLARRGADRQAGPHQPAIRVGDGGGDCRRPEVPRAHQPLDDGLLSGPAVVPLPARQPCDSHRAAALDAVVRRPRHDSGRRAVDTDRHADADGRVARRRARSPAARGADLYRLRTGDPRTDHGGSVRNGVVRRRTATGRGWRYVRRWGRARARCDASSRGEGCASRRREW